MYFKFASEFVTLLHDRHANQGNFHLRHLMLKIPIDRRQLMPNRADFI